MTEHSPGRRTLIVEKSRSPVRGLVIERRASPARLIEHHQFAHPPLVIRRPEYHQDVFITGLQAEVNELKQRHADYSMLMDVYKQLEAKYHDAMLEMQTMQVEYSGKIEKDR